MSSPKGAVNGWQCPDCGGITATVHVDTGVTPMFLGCRVTKGCRGMAVSLMYPGMNYDRCTTKAEVGLGDQNIPPEIEAQIGWEWFRPSDEDLAKMSPDEQEYVLMGKLCLRERPSEKKGTRTL